MKELFEIVNDNAEYYQAYQAALATVEANRKKRQSKRIFHENFLLVKVCGFLSVILFITNIK